MRKTCLIDYAKYEDMKIFDLNSGCDKTLKIRYRNTYNYLLFSLHSMRSGKWLNIYTYVYIFTYFYPFQTTLNYLRKYHFHCTLHSQNS